VIICRFDVFQYDTKNYFVIPTQQGADSIVPVAAVMDPGRGSRSALTDSSISRPRLLLLLLAPFRGAFFFFPEAGPLRFFVTVSPSPTT
jgi:hypothetical protein